MTRQIPVPHPAITVSVVVGYLIALFPGSLPRTAVVSAVFTTALVVGAAVVGALVVAARHRRAGYAARRRWAVAGGAVVLVAVALAGHRQASLSSDLGATAPGIAWYVAVVVVPAVAATGVVRMPRMAGVLAAVGALIVGLVPAGAHAAPGLPGDPHVLVGTLRRADFGAEARNLVARWVESGGPDERAVVIAVPTGSGWVDSSAITGFRSRFGDGVTILSLPYSDMSSWRAFVSDRSAAGDAAVALAERVAQAVEHQARQHRPQVFLYGQSLGAIGADEARRHLETRHRGLLTGTVLVAPPEGSVAESSATPRAVVANRSDPVTRWSVRSIWRPPAEPAGTVHTGRPVAGAPWVPMLSFLQTSVDLLGALDGPAGTGHRYGLDQIVIPDR